MSKRITLVFSGEDKGCTYCDRQSVSLAYDEVESMLVPVCRRHILAYRVAVDDRWFWQAEDEFANLQFCRRSRFKWVAQRGILRDQRAALKGKMSRYQVKRIGGGRSIRFVPRTQFHVGVYRYHTRREWFDIDLGWIEMRIR
jgi:hypothetical protein